MAISALTGSVLKTLGDLLKAARKRRGMSQADLAVRLGVDRRVVINIEKGSAKTSVGQVFEACYLLGIPLMSSDSKQLSQWQGVLQDFDALLPRPASKKKDLNDDF